MNEQPRLSRRAAFASVASGLVLGAVWGATFPIVASESRPSIAIVGHRGAQLVLIDSGKARALVFLGDPDDRLIERIPSIMTLFRQRIDVIVGTRPVMERRAFDLKSRWSIEHAVAVHSSAIPPSWAMPATVISDAASIDLGGEMTLRCTVGHRGEWLIGHESSSTPWSARLTHPSGEVVLVPDAASLDALGPVDAPLIVMPEPAPGHVQSWKTARALAINYDSDAAEENTSPTVAITRTYPQDIARFTFGNDGIELPAWTESAGTSSRLARSRVPKT